MSRLSAPQRLLPEHDCLAFESGVPVLDDWLRRRALQNESAGASRTYVVCAGSAVAGYYSLAVGAAAHDQVPGRIRRNMPDPVPVMILARLAVDRRHQGIGLGAGLLKDAIARSLQAADIAGIRAILVHAISEEARAFYLRFGFSPSPVDPMTLMLSIADCHQTKALAEPMST